MKSHHHRGGCVLWTTGFFVVSRTKLVPPRRHFDRPFNRYCCMISLVRFTAGLPYARTLFHKGHYERLIAPLLDKRKRQKKEINKSRIVIAH